MDDVELNIPPLHINNSHTDVPTPDDETCLISQFEQLHLRIDRFENRVSSDIGELSNQINQMFAQHSELICDTPKHGGPLTNCQSAEYLRVSSSLIPQLGVLFIGIQSQVKSDHTWSTYHLYKQTYTSILAIVQ